MKKKPESTEREDVLAYLRLYISFTPPFDGTVRTLRQILADIEAGKHVGRAAKSKG